MVYPGWVTNKTPNTVVSLEAVADQIDYINRLSGNKKNTAIGSDLDGGFGIEQCPYDLDTIFDLQKIPHLLKNRKYSDYEIQQIMSENWLRIFRRVWSKK